MANTPHVADRETAVNVVGGNTEKLTVLAERPCGECAFDVVRCDVRVNARGRGTALVQSQTCVACSATSSIFMPASELDSFDGLDV